MWSLARGLRACLGLVQEESTVQSDKLQVDEETQKEMSIFVTYNSK